ncbi:MAG: threonine--tRNA ligase [Bacteroidetes bacterium GWE2_29_8]|nr:MAG: threonine--tRNA ligase [Bacteroidetes bacterium GWE2_29_8]OFY18373.1 MAG: threonine--tRNA ligase [Bacteroidetes bacterium GWF2_29_10]
MIKIIFPDSRVVEYPKGITGLEIATQISNSLAKNVLGVLFNDKIIDATLPIYTDGRFKLLTWDDEGGKSVFWHSSAHLMAEAIKELYPTAKFAIGPDIENGFYYDIDFMDESISSDNFDVIEKKMLELARKEQVFERKSISKQEAITLYKSEGNKYKLELIEDLEDNNISLYVSGSFTDLCRGPHLPHTGHIRAVKLLNIAGAYWRGNEKNKQLTRIYGITFPKQKELTEYLAILEEAKKRDHRKLGKELELFAFSPSVGMGLPLWLPKGAELRERLENFLKKAQKKHGYLPIISPHIGNIELYKTSGHFQKYGEDSFRPITTPVEGEEFFLKPMNCPHHCEVYKIKPRSYKDLPIRFAEFGTVYRYEQSGELHGLTRVRGFTQDDAHIFCTPEQLKEEFIKVIDIVLYIFKTLKFDNFIAQISLRDVNNKEKYIGTDENWEKAENAIVEAVKEKGLNSFVKHGEAAFYGPKLDFMVKDAIGRKWQLGTIQVDYNLPERFELEYTGSDNQKHRPVMIHRAPFGSLERFVAILLEHTGGNFPLWLTSTHAMIIPISDKFIDYAKNVCDLLQNSDIRAEIDDRNEKAGKKIRDAEMSKTPFMLIIGEKEENNKTITIRKHGGADLGEMVVEDFTKFVHLEISNETSDIN